MERIPFDLQRALRGDALVDRLGNDVTGFRYRRKEFEGNYLMMQTMGRLTLQQVADIMTRMMKMTYS